MFEFHGWIHVDTSEQNSGVDATLSAVNEILRAYPDDSSIAEVRHTGNDMIVVLVHGLRNHWHPRIIELFKTLASSFPLSYGLLHVRDQESANGNEFQVFRIARGLVQAFADPFLSPCVPVIEDEYLDGED